MIHPRDFDGKPHGWRFRVKRNGRGRDGGYERFYLVGDARLQLRRIGGKKVLAIKARKDGARYSTWLAVG